ncbi:Allantoicase [Venturia nashicola]|uniref:Allantoicase n=1 Tax=Venturia nashicola TaxID=86259 RepID=A0A4Z1P1T6_9PEZI|nr:Allantoicase [Venturia nashicola]
MAISDAPSSETGHVNELQASTIPHHPTPPGSVSPTEHAQNFTFSPADDVTPVKKKPARSHKKRPAYSGVRKRTPKKKVHFNNPLEEVRLIDSQDPPIAASPASSSTYKSNQTQAVRDIRWTGFGTNHLPRHYPAIPPREAEEQAKEEKQARELNRTHDPGYDPIQYLVHLIHTPTSIEFSLPRELLRGKLADVVNQGAIDNANKKLEFDLRVGTPAGICLYVHVLIMGGEKIVPRLFHGAWEQTRKVHTELEEMSWVAVLLSGLLTARELQDQAFEGLIVDELIKVGGEALAEDS